MAGLLIGAVVVAGPAVIVAVYGLLPFRDIDGGTFDGDWQVTADAAGT